MRVRFAPSPTGYLHVGNARMAIINYLIAKKNGADFILRIEDTDMERSSTESEQGIISDLQWLGIQWDEGPDKGGDFGPYRQSERFDIYRKYTEKLIQSGDAYRCYCTKEELEEMKRGAQGDDGQYSYSGKCRNLSEDERKKLESEGKSHSVRFRVPDNELIMVKDHIRGNIEFNSSHIGGDFILIRSDGVPTYNYIVIIDDALMGITHVIRGEDHLSNTPKQLLVARALGLPEPEYAHASLILGSDRSKLSKRHGITSVERYRSEGYLPEAMVNYLAMLGWASASGEEILSSEEIIQEIELSTIAKSAAVFDFQKLKWMNGSYIRGYPLGKITDLFIPHLEKCGYSPDAMDRSRLEEIVDLTRGYCDVLPDICTMAGIFLEEIPEPDGDADTLLREDDSKKLVAAAHELIRTELNETNFRDNMADMIKESTSLKGKKLFMPIRAMITGRLKGPDMDKAMTLIGFDRCRNRIEYCYNKYCS